MFIARTPVETRLRLVGSIRAPSSLSLFPMKMMRLVFWCCVLAGVAGCRGASEAPPTPEATPASEAASPAFRNVHADAIYVGDDQCFSCHEDEYQGYQAHGMANSWYRLTPENAVEDFGAAPVYHAATDLYYRPFAEDGRFFQEEYRLGPDGTKTHRLVREIHYVVGSGTAARTYLTEKNGYLYELPLTWYTQVGKWDFSPGYREDNPRFDRLVPERCMACHNSFPEAVPFTEGKYASVPLGIGCERCHGPGSLHVDERLADPEPAGEVDPTIVNPAHLPLDRRLDVCRQCHLSGTTYVLREGRGAFDFRPSENLADHLSLFYKDVPEGSENISVISHADRMKKSACFRATLARGEPMECVTCHNPHEGFRDKGPAYFNTTCLDCHAPAALAERFPSAETRADHTPEANCIACHMPKVEVREAPHSSFTDHWIRVVEPSTEVTPFAAHDPPRLLPYFPEDAEGTDGLRYEGIAYVVYGTLHADTLALREGIARLERALADAPEHGEAQYLLGYARMQLGRVAAALPALEEAVRLGPDVPERLNALAQAYEAAGRAPDVIARLYRRALAIQPALADVRVNYGRFLEAQGRTAEAVAEYRKAAEERPWLTAAHFNLGSAYVRNGDMEKGERELLRTLELDPDDAEALSNLGLLYLTGGRTEDGERLFERAVKADPHNAVALGNLGAYYLSTDRYERAIDLLTRAVEIDPRYVDALANLSLAYFRVDDLVHAETYARRALDLDPSQALARQIVAAL